MVTEWIDHQRYFIVDDLTTIVALASTSRKIMDSPDSKNMSIGIQKSIKNAQNSTTWIDSGTWIIFLYSVIFLLAVIGNLLVILTLIQSRRMRTITNLFLLNLAVSDLFLGVFCMPFTLVGTLLRDFIFGELMCKLLPYLQGVFDCFRVLETVSKTDIDSGQLNLNEEK